MKDIAQPFFHEEVDISSHDANFVPIDNDLDRGGKRVAALHARGERLAHGGSKGEGLHCTHADVCVGRRRDARLYITEEIYYH